MGDLPLKGLPFGPLEVAPPEPEPPELEPARTSGAGACFAGRSPQRDCIILLGDSGAVRDGSKGRGTDVSIDATGVRASEVRGLKATELSNGFRHCLGVLFLTSKKPDPRYYTVAE